MRIGLAFLISLSLFLDAVRLLRLGTHIGVVWSLHRLEEYRFVPGLIHEKPKEESVSKYESERTQQMLKKANGRTRLD